MTLLGDAPVVREGLLRLDPPALLGSQCEACGFWAFPSQAECARCGDVEVCVHPLSPAGTIYSYTVVRIPVPGYCGPVPYGLGVVELAQHGLRVAALLLADSLDDLRVDASVTFELVDIGVEGTPVLSYGYRLEAP